MTKAYFTKKISAAVVMILLCAGFSFSVNAASTNVTVGSPVDRFTPTNVTINAGDQVIWIWVVSNHSSTSGTNGVASGLWGSGVLASGSKFTNAFPSAGNFAYYCSQHVSFGMTGSVFVAAANIAPTVSITNPLNNATFSAPANVLIQASASDSDGSVTNVQFLVGSTILTNVTTSPFSGTTNNLAAGSYNLSAIAFDNLGVKNTNSVSINVVTPVTVSLANAAKFSGTNFQFSYSANVGLSYVIQHSTNLASTNWISVVTNVAASNPVVFVDVHATNNPNFYRVGRMPNP